MTSLSAPRFRLALCGLFVFVVAVTMMMLRSVAHADVATAGAFIRGQIQTSATK